MRRSLSLFAPLVVVLLASCATKETVVILPAADGHVGGVVVQSGGKTVVLDKAYAADNPGDGQAGMANPDQVNKDFADALAARPTPPGHYFLNFKNDSDDMTPESQTYFRETVLPDVYTRGAAEIMIIGHTDSKGGQAYNDGLSLKRSVAVKQALLHNDFLSDKDKDKLAHINIMTAGRGLRDDKDPPETDNPKERYAEVFVQ